MRNNQGLGAVLFWGGSGPGNFFSDSRGNNKKKKFELKNNTLCKVYILNFLYCIVSSEI